MRKHCCLRTYLNNTMERDSRRLLVWILVILFILTVAVPLYFYFDPTHAHLAPKCPFHLLTGLDCPSCGNQRALHSLLHGEVWLSFRYNPFMWLCGPYILLLVLSALLRGRAMQRLYDRLTSNSFIIVYVVVYCVWWVVRNLPFWHDLVDLSK